MFNITRPTHYKAVKALEYEEFSNAIILEMVQECRRINKFEGGRKLFFRLKDEINRIISISKVNNFFCLNLDGLFNESSNKLTIYRFNNQVEDWMKILSPSGEYTLWDSLLFNNDNMIIIKPWSAGYNTLIAGEESVVRRICQDEHWLFNKKHPIYPL